MTENALVAPGSDGGGVDTDGHGDGSDGDSRNGDGGGRNGGGGGGGGGGNSGPGAGNDEVEPVELLVQLAKDGEIEPWDIDIVEVTDAFLALLDKSDLRTSGRALFYASVLLRMKSDVLLEPEVEKDEQEFEELVWDEMEDGAAFDPIDGLEREMDRRLDRKRARGTPETLDELVRDLREAELHTWWKPGREYDTSGSPRGFRRGTQTLDYRTGDDFRLDDEPTEAEVTGTAHDEHVDEIIDAVEEALSIHYDAGRPEVLFEEIATAGGTRVETFLGILFLSHRGHVVLQQDDLFGDLWIQDPSAIANPATVSSSS